MKSVSRGTCKPATEQMLCSLMDLTPKSQTLGISAAVRLCFGAACLPCAEPAHLHSSHRFALWQAWHGMRGSASCRTSAGCGNTDGTAAHESAPTTPSGHVSAWGKTNFLP